MFNKTFFYTSIFAALYMTISLKFLELFSFIKWSPISWVKYWNIMPTAHFTVKWVLLYIALLVVFALLYIILSFLDAIPPSITAIIIGFIGVFVLEWFIDEPKTPIDAVRSISVPLLAVIAIVLRFVAGTAVFKIKKSEKA